MVDFLFHYLTFSYDRVRTLAHGANQQNLNALLIKSILLPLPDIEEQSEVASVLSACDMKIACLEREIKLLDELFRAMLEELMMGRLSAVPLAAIPAEVSA